MTKIVSQLEIDPKATYISVGSQAFGEFGFIVGCSEISKTGAFVQRKKAQEFCLFGDILTERVGIITPLDYLVKVEPFDEPPPPFPRRSNLFGFK
jgi:hypothetical protein